MKKVEKFIEDYIKLLTSSIMETDMKNLNHAALQILKTIKKVQLYTYVEMVALQQFQIIML